MALPDFFSGFIAYFLAFLVLAAPWFHGLTGLQDQLAVQVIIFTVAFLIVLFRPKDFSFCLGMPPADRALFSGLLLTGVFVVISVLPFYSLMTWVRFLSVVVLYRLARFSLQYTVSRRVLWTAFLLMGVFYSIYGLLQYYGPLSKEYWYSSSDLASRYVNSGHFAGLLILPVFVSAILLTAPRTFIIKILLILSLVLFGVTLVLTRSRTVWISLTVGLILYFFLLFKHRLVARRWLWAGLILTAAIIAGGCVSGFSHKIIQRFAEIWDGKNSNFFSIQQRLFFWEGALRAIKARPWGWGLGTFVHIFPSFRIHADRFIVDYAHNELFQLGVDFGIPGLVVIILLFVQHARQSVKLLSLPWVDMKLKIQGAGFLGCTTSLVLASLFDFPLRIYATVLLFAVFMAYPVGYLQNEKAAHVNLEKSKVSRWIFGGILFLFMGGIFLSTKALLAETALREGIRLEKIFDWDRAMVKYQRAIRFAPWQNDYYEFAASLAEKRAVISFDPQVKRNWLSTALNFYSGSTKSQPFGAASFYRAGVILEFLGESEKAGKFLQAAHEKESTNAIYIFDYALFCLRHHRLVEAVDLLEQTVKLEFREKLNITVPQLLETVYPYVKDVNQLQRILPTGWSSRYDLGFFLGKQGRWDQAVPVIDQALSEAKQTLDFDFYMGHVAGQAAQFYLDHGLLEPALTIYEEAAQRSSDRVIYQQKQDEIRKRIKATQVSSS